MGVAFLPMQPIQYFGEIISLVVACSWTATALFAEVASKRLGSLQLNVIRLTLSIFLLGMTLWIVTGVPYPRYATMEVWSWLMLSGLVGYVFGDFCLFNSYVLIGSRFGQLFMTLAPLAAAISGWVLLGESLSAKAYAGMFVTMAGIGMSVFGKGGDESHHKITLKLPLKGVVYGIGAGIGQGLGLVLSKVGMEYYEQNLPTVGAEVVADMMPFASTLIRAVAGSVGFLLIMGFSRKLHTLSVAMKDSKGMKAAIGATLTGPFIGVSLSLMAVLYTEAGIASTLMALTPVLIIWPAHLIFKQQVRAMEVAGAVVSVVGASLFFL